MDTKAKGMVGNSVGALIMLITGVGIAVLILIFVGVLAGNIYQTTESKLESIGANVIVADTFTALNNTKVNLAHSFIQENTLAIYNASGEKEAYSLTNFTIDYDEGSVTLKAESPVELNDTSMAANYTWGAVEVRNYVKEGVVSGFSGLKTVADYTPIMALAIIIVIVLGIILGMTSFKGVGGQGGSAL